MDTGRRAASEWKQFTMDLPEELADECRKSAIKHG